MDLAYRVFGKGPTLVLMHGIVHCQDAWNPVIPQLAKHRRVVTIDLPSHGLSPQLPATERCLQALADEVEEFLPTVTPEGDQVHVAGNSLGGWLALELAARGAVASATALSPGGFWVSDFDRVRTNKTFLAMRSVARVVKPLRGPLLSNRVGRSVALGAFFGRPWRVSPDDAIRDIESLTTNTLIDVIQGEDWAFSAQVDPSIPITVQWGGGDLILPVYEAAKVRDAFPQARVIVMPWIGHVPMIDDPEEIAAILIEGSSGR
ncbi:alpha/beta hydrolase [Hoyosella sp. YIM 151337]|uniref:alpha/beta fold hydrolase n=1 Tax=Hoyosella sp. YIM 151337 TaxID=2992742 RepID=UPI002236A73C|nr:alpha/beta hydrolase [Hoyosella sp. YIM 151337]MCW4354822.1 alpha/beta hydrolase [Hoyosella sp. YIM 151337]